MTLPWAKAKRRTYLGKLLTDARVRNQIPLVTLAAAAGLHKQGCCRLLNTECSKLSTALALGRALGVKDTRVVKAWAMDRVAAEGLVLKIDVGEG